MTTYADHQNLIQEFKLACLKEIPNLFLFDRHVGVFYTKRGTPIRISIPGQADVYGYYFGHAIELEFKTGKAKQNPDQIRWESFCKKNNILYLIIREDFDINEIKNKLQSSLHLLK